VSDPSALRLAVMLPLGWPLATHQEENVRVVLQETVEGIPREPFFCTQRHSVARGCWNRACGYRTRTKNTGRKRQLRLPTWPARKLTPIKHLRPLPPPRDLRPLKRGKGFFEILLGKSSAICRRVDFLTRNKSALARERLVKVSAENSAHRPIDGGVPTPGPTSPRGTLY